MCDCPLHPTAAVGQHPTQLGTTALPGANPIPAELQVASYSLLALSILKKPPKESPGQVKESTPRELYKMKCRGCWWRGRAWCSAGQGCREAAGQEPGKPASACRQPANLSEVLSVLPTYPVSPTGQVLGLQDVSAPCFCLLLSLGGKWGKPWGRICSGYPQTCQSELAELLTRSLVCDGTVLSSNPVITLCTLQHSPDSFPS